jgi:hypothetical protein
VPVSLRLSPAVHTGRFARLNLRSNTSQKFKKQGRARQVKAAMKAVALGAMASGCQTSHRQRLEVQRFSGHPATAKRVVFHIQEFSQD